MAIVGRRVVVTGIGLVSPLGCGTAKNWESLLAGRSGISRITSFDPSGHPVKIAGEVRDFNAGDYFEKKELKKVDRFIQMAVASSQMALEDAGLKVGDEQADRAGVAIGVGMGGIATLEEGFQSYYTSGLRRLSPFFIPRLIANMAAGHVAMRFGWRGANLTPSAACASGGHGIGEAYRLIRFGDQDYMLAGGAEAPITPMGVGGFAVMRALSTRNDDPEAASRPFDAGRDGFVMAEGAGVLVLETLDGALARGARIYAEIAGYGANADAYHMTSPAPEGRGVAQCMRRALEDGGIDPNEVDYINAHGTSTPYNDANETVAIKRVFGEHAYGIAVSSTKSMTGHLLGGAGGVEGGYTALSVYQGMLPPTINLEQADPECDLDYVANVSRRRAIRVALSNSFGFGGTNACIAFRSLNGAASG